MSNSELINWFIAFLNGADYSSEEDYQEYVKFNEEASKRNADTQSRIEYLKSVL